MTYITHVKEISDDLLLSCDIALRSNSTVWKCYTEHTAVQMSKEEQQLCNKALYHVLCVLVVPVKNVVQLAICASAAIKEHSQIQIAFVNKQSRYVTSILNVNAPKNFTGIRNLRKFTQFEYIKQFMLTADYDKSFTVDNIIARNSLIGDIMTKQQLQRLLLGFAGSKYLHVQQHITNSSKVLSFALTSNKLPDFYSANMCRINAWLHCDNDTNTFYDVLRLFAEEFTDEQRNMFVNTLFAYCINAELFDYDKDTIASMKAKLLKYKDLTAIFLPSFRQSLIEFCNVLL